MRRRRILGTFAILGLFGGATAGAQDAGKTGITMAYPGSFGILWHATDKVAIRPTFNVARSTADGSTSSGTNWTFGTTIAGLFYMKKYDNVRTYFSPRYTYSRISSTTHVGAIQGITVPDLKTTGNSNGGSGTFGAEYTPGSRFSVFGEVGVVFTRATTSSSGLTASKTSGNAWGTTAGVGVIFYP
ncbi:MAG TPA: hypothetical protein VL225_16050 [Vicinamibacterales bacterium]|jgi:hypothetical protein|nr:hypothetical protein [Vicinamibacterales bacterium]